VPKEDFEGAIENWSVGINTAGGGSIAQNTEYADDGNASAKLAIQGSGQSASLVDTTWSDASRDHIWRERPGTWHWQRVSLYIPSETSEGIGVGESITLAGTWANGSPGHGWWLQVRQDGALWVRGFDRDGVEREFYIYGTVPVDRWFDLEIGLHTQNGPGVKRAFAFLIDGHFYGWYHQGNLKDETYDRVAFGFVETNSQGAKELYLDRWQQPGSAQFPTGDDLRSTASVQEQDFRFPSGEQWQIDWSTWGNDLVLDPQAGIYSVSSRLQSGRNLERMPPLADGWGEMEIGWTRGAPPDEASLLQGAFAGMVGMRKEINVEENLEVILSMDGNRAKVIYEAWVDGGAVPFAQWELPKATSLAGRALDNLPEPGDILRVRWNEVSNRELRVRASYYDQSTNTWHNDIIDSVQALDRMGTSGVNYFDGHHLAASITIDTPYYGIRHFRVGTLDTYPDE